MNKEQIRKIREGLEKLAEEGREICQGELNNCKVKDELILNMTKLAYKMYILGIKRACEIFYEVLGINYEHIKFKTIEDNKLGENIN